jgi:hypothetical protein
MSRLVLSREMLRTKTAGQDTESEDAEALLMGAAAAPLRRGAAAPVPVRRPLPTIPGGRGELRYAAPVPGRRPLPTIPGSPAAPAVEESSGAPGVSISMMMLGTLTEIYTDRIPVPVKSQKY